jgi:hypothetical protein
LCLVLSKRLQKRSMDLREDVISAKDADAGAA